MENFLASRPAITKLGSSMKNLSGGVFTPMGEKKTDAVIVTPPPGAATPAAGTSLLAHGAGQAGDDDFHAVRVEVIRENGAVERIVVHCQCGERIELDCLY